MIKNGILLHILFVILLISSCSQCSKNEHVKDVSNIDVEIPLTRFEQDLFACGSVAEIQALKEKHPDFYPIYTQYILSGKLGDPRMVNHEVELYKYISNFQMDSLYKMTQEKFGDFEPYYSDLKKAAKYITSYFPEDTITGITTFVSAFEYGSLFNQLDKSFAVGLDLCMGQNFEIYPQLPPESFPAYRIKHFNDYNIVPNAVRSYLDFKTPKYVRNNFAEQAVYEGVVLYGMDVLVPWVADSLKIGYLNQQLEWNFNNESNIWTYLIESDGLFSSDKNYYEKHFFSEGPFTAPLQQGSSPKLGSWLGWQIVRKYMETHPETTYNQLLELKDYKLIFEESGYRP